MSAFTALVAAYLAAGPAWRPPYPHLPLPADQVAGTTLCASNPDGGSLVLDAPGPEWSWRVREGSGAWFAGRPDATSAEFMDVVHVARIWGMPDCATIRAGPRRPPPRGWVFATDSCGFTDIPEPGTLRVVTRLVLNGRLALESAGYFTPHGYHFTSRIEDGLESPRFLTFLRSYRLDPDRTCGPAPVDPRRAPAR